MKIEIRPLTSFDGGSYEVLLDQNRVIFQSENEALKFVQKLQERLASPHSLPPFSREAPEEPPGAA